jgi:carboxyl-terminal processing protease
MLEVQSPGKPLRSVEVKRGKLTSTGKLEAYRVTGTNYGYLLLPSVGYGTLTRDIVQALQTFTTDGKLEGLILDLRIANSTGGWPLQEIYTLFGTGVLAELYNREDRQSIEVKGQDVFGSQTLPMVILVGQNTIGFPEILAAGLQQQKRATVIGERTTGAVETTTAFYLPDGSQVFIESTSFRLLPGGEEIGTTGVTPDISVNVSWDQIQPNQDPVLARAIEYLDGQK